MIVPFLGCILFIALYLILKEPVTRMFMEKSSLVVSYYYWVIPLIISKISTVSMRHDFSSINKPLRKDIFRYSLFLIIGSLGGVILGKLDFFMISGSLGLDYTGIYTIAFNMVAVIEIPSRSISAISSPIAADALKKGDLKTANELYQSVSLHQLLVGGFIFLLIWINIDNIFEIIPEGNTYAAGKWVVFFLGISKLVTMTLGFGGILISYSKYYYWSLYFAFFLTAFGILTNIWLIPLFGITGAAIATLSSCLLGCIVQQWLALKKVKGNPYTPNLLKTVMIFFTMTGINYLLFEIDNPWLDGICRTAIISVIGAALLYFFKVSSDLNNTILVIVRKLKLFLIR
jgi:O-antigen/teichoic acid export membrane protein